MKKFLLLGMYLFIAQALYAQKMNIGLYLSPSTNWMRSSNEQVNSDGGRTSFDYGVMVEFKLDNNERYVFSSGLSLANRGGDLLYSTPLKLRSRPNIEYPAATLLNYRLQYLEVPLNLRLRITETNKFTPFAQLGFNPGFALNTNADITPPVNQGGISGSSKTKLSKDVRDLSFGFVVGAGTEFELSEQTRLMASLIYYNGLTNTLKHTSPALENKVAQSSLSLRLGIFF